MTLCISFKHYNRQEYDQAFTIADSRLTVIRKETQQVNEEGISILPANTKIVHQNDFGIKLHVIKHRNKKNERDIVIAVAGAVSLGIQSIIHLEACFAGLYGHQTFEQTIELIETTIDRFWENSYDKDIEYLITLADDETKTRIFRKIGRDHSLSKIEEILPEHEMTLGVIGDNCDAIKKTIFGEVNTLLVINNNIPIEAALDAACGRAMRREIENDENVYVGGYIQAAAMKGKEGYYMGVHYKDGISFRGVFYGKEVSLAEYPFKYPSWPYNWDIYNPKIELELVAEQLSKNK